MVNLIIHVFISLFIFIGIRGYIVGLTIKLSSNVDILDTQKVYLAKLNLTLVQVNCERFLLCTCNIVYVMKNLRYHFPTCYAYSSVNPSHVSCLKLQACFVGMQWNELVQRNLSNLVTYIGSRLYGCIR